MYFPHSYSDNIYAFKTSKPDSLFNFSDEADSVNIASVTKNDEYFNFSQQEQELYEETSYDDNELEKNHELSQESIKMPEAFYNEIENFLNRPAPSISTKTKANTSGIISKKQKNSGSNSTSIINNLISKKQSSNPITKSRLNSQQNVFGDGGINESLLREAFAYTDKLMQVYT